MICSAAAAEVGEPLAGTATHCNFWLVIEQPGPYKGRDAAFSSRLDHDTAVELTEAVAQRGGKLLLVRRPDRRAPDETSTRRAWLVRGYPTAATTGLVADPAETLEWLDGGGPDPVESPVLLVCTHGRRDACCARLGRALLDVPADVEVWESSHIGGHRFAPVVMDLMTGYQHGRVGRSDLEQIVNQARLGMVHLPTNRGHHTLDAASQAVELAVREQLGILEVVGIRIESDGDAYRVATPDRTLAARVEHIDLGERSESCGGDPKPAYALWVTLT